MRNGGVKPVSPPPLPAMVKFEGVEREDSISKIFIRIRIKFNL